MIHSLMTSIAANEIPSSELWVSRNLSLLFLHMPGQKVSHEASDFVAVGFQREVPGI